MIIAVALSNTPSNYDSVLQPGDLQKAGTKILESLTTIINLGNESPVSIPKALNTGTLLWRSKCKQWQRHTPRSKF